MDEEKKQNKNTDSKIELPDTKVPTEQPTPITTSPEIAAEVSPTALGKSQPKTKKAFYRNKRNVLIITGVVILLGLTASWFVFLKKSPEPQATVAQPAEQVKLLGAAVTVVDGSVQISSDGSSWQNLTLETEIKQGDTIKTSETGRAVISLDDGSAVRVNSTSTLKLTSLAADDIVVANESGEVYTRVVASDRTFSVTVGNESYVALGTAYLTTNRDTTKGVEVYHSEVSVSTVEEKIAEGKRYYQQNPTPELEKKVTDIPADELQTDDFLKWNLDHDKQNSEFSDKLGYFVTLEKTPVSKPAPTPKPSTPTAGITLTGSKTEKGVSLSWTVTGLATSKGFKVVRGAAANPTYGKQDATFVEASARSTTWKITDGKTYHFRVCMYNADGTCTNYSNDITVAAPYVAPPAEPTGSLNLTHIGSNNVSWALSGSAPYGLKLVWSTSPGPTYPGSSAKYFEGASKSSAQFDGDSGKTYYVRVCMYYEGTCKNYSNEITVALP